MELSSEYCHYFLFLYIDNSEDCSRLSISAQNDIRTDMGEDGLSFHELPAPKTLRFSTDEANPLDILSTTTAPAPVPSQDISSNLAVERVGEVEKIGEIGDNKCVPTSGGKYADFIKVSFSSLLCHFSYLSA